jgi:hypothetical protein
MHLEVLERRIAGTVSATLPDCDNQLTLLESGSVQITTQAPRYLDRSTPDSA